ncbi:hypothetical protein B0J11DRAFT_505378 [Dendryphion nanum]|uniref:Uncharacterized protein n=1 Tax=Dendryphion nanum TaxID=256645 RepID=A0A9P9DWS0_9PLEO|nr:hypothetical protein B0J11DRAFT_505378 [Dendryphion nanum]
MQRLTLELDWINFMVVPPIVAHAPPKLLAKQWLQAYQYAVTFVPPFVITGTISNALLAYYTPSYPLRFIYGAAALLTWSILPVTVLFFEPCINGAAKWKVQQLLHDEGFVMQENKGIMLYVDVHTAKPEWRTWAEGVDMKDIAVEWASLNKWRFVVTAIAAMSSAVATQCRWSRSVQNQIKNTSWTDAKTYVRGCTTLHSPHLVPANSRVFRQYCGQDLEGGSSIKQMKMKLVLYGDKVASSGRFAPLTRISPG